MDFIIYRGKKYEIENDFLNLTYNNVNSIYEIENLDRLPKITILFLSNNKITEIEGFEKLNDLEILRLDNNEITEIKGLANLKKLKILSLSYNKISEIKGLNELVNLKELNLEGNQIEELKGLESLIKLEELNLSSNKFLEIKGLEELKFLNTLYLSRNKIKEIQGLNSLSNLKVLDLERNLISEFKGLEKLINLERLLIKMNNINEIKGLGALKSLKKLMIEEKYFGSLSSRGMIDKLGGFNYRNDEANDPQKIVSYCDKLEHNAIEFVIYNGKKYYVVEKSLELINKGIKDIKEILGLERLVNLEELSLRVNKIKKIESLDSLVNLKKLDLLENVISKIEGLENLKNLEYLSLSYNQIQEIENIEHLQKLEQLWIGENRISRIKGLDNLKNLKNLYLGNNKISEIEGLDNLIDLTELYLEENKIPEIKGLNNLKDLIILHLGKNKISEIKGLDNLNNLETLRLEENKIRDVKGLENLKKLKEIELSRNKLELPPSAKGFRNDGLLYYIRLKEKLSKDLDLTFLGDMEIKILNEMADMGDLKAKKTYLNLLFKNSNRNDFAIIKDLFNGPYLKSLTKNELKALIQDPNIKLIKNLLSLLKNAEHNYERSEILGFLKEHNELILKKDKKSIEEWIVSVDYEFLKRLIKEGFLKCLDKESAENIFNNEKIKQNILNELEERGFMASESLKILKKFANFGSKTAKDMLMEKVLSSIIRTSQINLSDILNNNYLDCFEEKELDTFLKESSPKFLTEFFKLLNQDLGVFTTDISYSETDKPEKIKKILKEHIIKQISLEAQEKVNISKKYVNLLSVLNDKSIVFSLIDILKDILNFDLFDQVKSLWTESGIYDIRHLTKMLGKLVIYSTEIKMFKISTGIRSEKYYYISEIFRKLNDLFKCILLSYFSEDTITQLKQMIIIFELVLILNQAIDNEIAEYFEHADLCDVNTEYERFRIKKEHFEYNFGIHCKSPSITFHIKDQKLTVFLPSYIYKKEKFEKINRRDVKFVLNRKKIAQDRVIEQKWFKDFLKDYYQAKDYSELIRSLTEEIKKEITTLEKAKDADINDIVNFRGTRIPNFESKILQEIELYSTRKFTFVKEFKIYEDSIFYLEFRDENDNFINKKLEEKEENLKYLSKLRISNFMGFTTEDNRVSGLSIYYGDTTKFPNSIGNLTALKQLYITAPDNFSRKNVQIESLPDSIGQLTSLKVLVVTGQNLKNIPDSIGNLTELYHLNLDGNNLEVLPESIGKLKNLRFFYLGSNKLLELPKSFKNLNSLITLDMTGSFDENVKILPDLNGLTNLQYLNLMNNNFTDVTGLKNLKSLKSVNLRNNKITEIKGFENLTNLKKLNLSANEISEIKGLETLNNLVELDLGGEDYGAGDISEIKGLGTLINLKTLNLNNNKIFEITDLDNLRNLEELDLYHNKLVKISGLDSLVKLTRLSINGNRIKDVEGLEHLIKLEKLVIGTSFSRELVSQLGGVKKSYYSLGMEEFNEVCDPLRFVEYCAKSKGKDFDIFQIKKVNFYDKIKSKILSIKTKSEILKLLYNNESLTYQQVKEHVETSGYDIDVLIRDDGIVIMDSNTTELKLNPPAREALREIYKECEYK